MLVAAGLIAAGVFASLWALRGDARGAKTETLPAAQPTDPAAMTVAGRLTPMWVSPDPIMPTWIPTIDRRALLPHLYAGICMNCHVVLGELPTLPVGPDTPGLLPVDQELVRAGQRVLVPTPMQALKAPLITRESILPHVFKGECSNCHSIVQAGRGASPEYLAQGLQLARTRLVGRGLSDSEIARAQIDPRASVRSIAMISAGIVALGLFLVSMVYVVMKTLIKLDPKKWRARIDIKKWFRIHEWSSIALAAVAVVHWLLSEQGNAFLHVSLLLLVGLAISGVAYRARALKAHRKSMRWVHTQRSLTYVLIALAIAGHLMID